MNNSPGLRELWILACSLCLFLATLALNTVGIQARSVMEIQNPCLDFGGTSDQNHLAPETTTPWNNWAHLIHLRFNYVFAIKIINKIVLQFTSPLRPSKNRVKKCQGGWMINWRDIRKKMCLKKKVRAILLENFVKLHYVFKSILIRTANTVCARLRQINQIQFQ